MENQRSGVHRNVLRRTRRPKFWGSPSWTASTLAKFVSLPLVVAGMWFIEWQYASVRLDWRHYVGTLCLWGIIVVGHYLAQWRRYLTWLEWSHLQLRMILLAASGIDSDTCEDDPIYQAIGIASDSRGNVNLVLDAHKSPGLQTGSRLDVLATPTREVWGTVEIVEANGDRFWALPRDRARPEFWEDLEDRMNKNPSPPPSVHMEPALEPGLRRLLESGAIERKGHDE